MGSIKRWLIMQKDGRLRLHQENDGPRFVRRGAEASETIVTRAELKQRFPTLYASLEAAEARRENSGCVVWER